MTSRAVIAAATLLAASDLAHADPEPDPCSFVGVTSLDGAGSIALFAAGALTGFLAHESGHLAMNLALGNTPTLDYISVFGFIPFFSIDPQLHCDGTRCVKADNTPLKFGEAGKYTIVTAGFDVQHLTTELLLSLEPELRFEHAPFRKGLLAFDLLLSAGYALASVAGVESVYGDVHNANDASGLPRVVFAAVLLAPAVIDAYRYFRPKSTWAPWASRAAKLGMIGISFAI